MSARSLARETALCLLATCLMLSTGGCRSLSPTAVAEPNLQRFEFEEPQMGVAFRIILYAENQKLAEDAADAAFRRIAELNASMSDYETDSEISKLSRTSEQGSPEVQLSDDMWNVLSVSQKLARETGGAFDITIGPCVGIWRKARREKHLPDPPHLQAARAKVGFKNLILYPKRHSARLLRTGMRLDVGAIAKGYAGDEALKAMRKLGVTRALVAASGDLTMGDAPPGTKGWKVELVQYDSLDAAAPIHVFLSNAAVATSGDLFQRVEIDGVRYSHILDPFTCIGMTNHALATVIAPAGMTADSLATAMTILDPSEALRVANHHGAGVRIIRDEKGTPRTYANERFKSLVRKDVVPKH